MWDKVRAATREMQLPLDKCFKSCAVAFWPITVVVIIVDALFIIRIPSRAAMLIGLAMIVTILVALTTSWLRNPNCSDRGIASQASIIRQNFAARGRHVLT